MKRIWFLVAGVVLVLGIGAGLIFGLGGEKPKTYTVEITSNVEQIEYESKNNCRLGDNITIEAIPLDGYRFMGWQVDGEIVSTDTEYTFELTEVDSHNIYKAIYKQEYMVYIGEIQNGEVTTNITKAIEGEQITLTITAGEHYGLAGVYYILYGETEHTQITNNTFTMPAGDVTVYANFQAIEYSITSAELEHGTLSFLPTVGTYGATITVTVTPDEGYELEENSLYYETDSVARTNITTKSGDNYVFTMPAQDVTVYATFVESVANVDELTTLSFIYNETDKTASVKANTGNRPTGDLVIPEKVKYNNEVYTITSMGSFAFSWCSSLTSITIPSSVTSIGSNAFKDCRSLTSITIPNSVTSIGDSVFYECNSLTSITIPSSVTSIGSDAFSGCDNLTSVVISNLTAWASISFVGKYANPLYYAHKLYLGSANPENEITEINNLENITEIKAYAFNNAQNITSVVLPDGVTSIGSNAFNNAQNITSVVLPDGVTSIGSNAFYGCNKLYIVNNLSTLNITAGSSSNGYVGNYAHMVVSEENFDEKIENIEGVLYYKESENSYIAVGLIDTTKTSVTFDENTTEICYKAFYRCSNLTSITIPNSVTNLGDWAFKDCSSITTVNFGNNSQLTSIGSYAFSACNDLTSITIPSSVTSIGGYAFRCRGLKTVNFGNNSQLTSIGDSVFYECNSLTSITIPNSVTSIGGDAFCCCSSLSQITIPDSVTSIGVAAFCGCCSLTSITIPSSVTSIGGDAFSGCYALAEVYNKSTSLNITAGESKYANGCAGTYAKVVFGPNDNYQTRIVKDEENGVAYYVYGADYIAIGLIDRTRTTIILNENTTEIDKNAFNACNDLISITIPSSVTSIGFYAFYNCNKLSSVVISNLSAWASISFGGYSANPLYYAKKLYQGSATPENEITELNADNLGNITEIKAYAFYNAQNITSINIPSSVTNIGSSAFQYCSSLTSITIPNSVTSIGNSAFSYCTGLTSIAIPSSVTSIGDYIFYECNSLTSITIPSSVTNIGSDAFYNCSSLTSITIPNSVTSIGNSAFSYCTGLTSIAIPSSVTSIGDSIFYNCSSLTSITIPSSVTSIGFYAFWDCRSLTSVIIGQSVSSIGDSAFYGCYALAEVYNLSEHITISKGSEDNGYVGKYAEYIQTNSSNASRIKILDGVAYYVNGSEFVAIGLIDRTITTLTFDERTTKIRGNAFRNCDNLRYVIVSSNVTRISDNAFYGCYNLQSIYIPSNVITISVKNNSYEYAPFYCCYNLHIYVEASSKPTDWKSKWNYCDDGLQCDVTWNYSLDNYKALIGYEG